MGKKLTFEYVKHEIEKEEGHRLLSTEYTDNRTKLNVKCPNNHTFEIRFDDFKRGRRCGICYTKNKKHTVFDVQETLKKINYTLVSTEYVNVKTKLDIRCNNGHTYQSNYNDVLAGNKCPFCGKRVKHKIEDIRSCVESFGYKLLSDKYWNVKTKITVQCDKGHTYSVSYSDFLNNRRCFECHGNKKHEFEYVQDSFVSDGYILLSSEYQNSHSKIEVICPKGHNYRTSFHVFSRGVRCGYCNNLKQEPLCRYIVEGLIGKQFPSVRPLFLRQDGKRIGLQLDMYNETLSLAIEYDGEYHFRKVGDKGNDFEAQQSRDKLKDQLCQKYGIYLIRIPYFIKDKESYIINELRNFWVWFIGRKMTNLLEYKPN